MLFPVKLKLAPFEAHALQQYMQRMVEISLDSAARNEVIILAEYFQRIDSQVRSKSFGRPRTVSTYNLPLSAARILWCRWQKEVITEALQLILNKLDYELNAMNRIPDFPKKLI